MKHIIAPLNKSLNEFIMRINTKALLFLLAFFVTALVFPQVDTISKSGTIHYEMEHTEDLLQNKSLPSSNNAVLHFNNTESLYVYGKIGMDSIQRGEVMKMDKKDGKITGVGINFSAVDETGFLIYRNFDMKSIILRFTDSFPSGAYIVQDNWLPLKWTIMKEYRNILGYDAQKAIGQFRGRIYIAWFTREIPVPYGPWKLFGLPGLILEAYDTANIAVFKVEKICYPCNDSKKIIREPNEKEHKTIKEHVYINDYVKEVITIKLNKISKNGHFIPSTSSTNLGNIQKKRKHRYEVLYEWEDYPGDTPNPYEKTLVEQAFKSVPQNVKIKFKRNFPKKIPDHYRDTSIKTPETISRSIPVEFREEKF